MTQENNKTSPDTDEKNPSQTCEKLDPKIRQISILEEQLVLTHINDFGNILLCLLKSKASPEAISDTLNAVAMRTKNKVFQELNIKVVANKTNAC